MPRTIYLTPTDINNYIMLCYRCKILDISQIHTYNIHYIIFITHIKHMYHIHSTLITHIYHTYLYTVIIMMFLILYFSWSSERDLMFGMSYIKWQTVMIVISIWHSVGMHTVVKIITLHNHDSILNTNVYEKIWIIQVCLCRQGKYMLLIKIS